MRAWPAVLKIFENSSSKRLEGKTLPARTESFLQRLHAVHKNPAQLGHKRFCRSDRRLIAQIKESLNNFHVSPTNGVAPDAFAAGLVALKYFWVRPFEEFTAPMGWQHKGNMDLQVALVKHLMLLYKIPPYLARRMPLMICAGNKNSFDRTLLVMAIAIGQGQSFRKIPWLQHPEIPNSFPQKLFDLPEEGLGYEEAFFKALILSLGGSERECEMLSDIDLILNPYCHNGFIMERINHFCFATARWVIRNGQELEDEQWRTIFSWAQHLMVESLRDDTPFSWKGRTMQSAHRSALAYRRESEEFEAVHLNCKPWHPQGWNWQHYVPKLGKCSFVELTTPEALKQESDAMNHCVKSYGTKCSKGWAAIFSLRVDGTCRLTIEVRLPERSLAQVFGQSNRLPSKEEEYIVTLWWRAVVKGGSND